MSRGSYGNGEVVYNRAHIGAGGDNHLPLEHGGVSSIFVPFSSAFTSRFSELLSDGCGSCVKWPGDVGSTDGGSGLIGNCLLNADGFVVLIEST